MQFNFGAPKKIEKIEKEEEKKPKDGLEGLDEIHDEVDITEGINEADCRLALNKLGRAASLFLLAHGISGTHNAMETPYSEVYKFLCRRALNYCDAVAGPKSPESTRKLLPFNIS